MRNQLFKVLKYLFASMLLIVTFTSCSNIAKEVANKSPFNHKYFSGSTNFNSLVDDLVQEQYSRIVRHLESDEVVLVSDFVNVDRLQNHSKLGFLLSEQLKNSLSKRGIIIRAVELGRDFQLGAHGFNLLTRKQKDIKDDTVVNKFAFVGTYSVTTESLILFTKLIDVETGNILSSASTETPISTELLQLERSPQAGQNSRIITPLVL